MMRVKTFTKYFAALAVGATFPFATTDAFTFKQFTVDDRGCGMPVSTDGVLLGAWASLPRRGSVVDVGAGSGLVALLVAQRLFGDDVGVDGDVDVAVDAVEIDPVAAAVARRNVAASPWSDRVACVERDVVGWARERPPASVDAIVCNPPWFDTGLRAATVGRARARHADDLHHDDLLAIVRRLLAEDGAASLVLPTTEGERLVAVARNDHDLHCVRRCEVRHSDTKPPTRLLLQLGKKELPCERRTLCLHNKDGDYSGEYRALTKDFYLKM